MIECCPFLPFSEFAASIIDMTSYYIYLVLLGISFLLGLWCRKSDPSLNIMVWLLLFSVLAEAIVYVLAIQLAIKPEFFLVYHIYVPLEYLFLSYYFSRQIKLQHSHQVFYALAIAVVAIDFYLSVISGNVFSYPGRNLNVSGILIVFWSATALFNVRPEVNRSLFSFPVFWIGTGYLLYYSASFFHNFIYGILVKSQAELAEALNDIINKGANDVLYICISIAFICSHRLMKST